MSNVKKTFHDDLLAAQLAAQELERRRREVSSKELTLKETRVNAQLERFEIDQKDLETAQKTSFGKLSKEEIDKLTKENTDYIVAARNKMRFILPDFDSIVPFFRKNLIFIGAKTGEGKSTAVANIVRETISQIRPGGGRRRVLVITNEEKSEDVYNRITCLVKKISYTNHDKFTDDQLKMFNEYLPTLSEMVTVVDDTYGGSSGVTTTPEGLDQIFKNLIRDNILYDAIIIDYYQNFTYSKRDYTLADWQVQSRISAILDRYKNIYPAPIVIFGQVAPNKEDGNVPFEFRIKGRKQILVTATVAIEMVAKRESLTTEWIIHKSRFSESVGGTLVTGFDKGRFVDNDSAFKAKILAWKEEKQRLEISRQSGINIKTGEKENRDSSKDVT